MSEAPDIPREIQLLGKLAELEAALAQEAYSRALAAETAEEFATYSREMARHARGGRITVALRDRLLKDKDAGPAPEVEQRLWRQRDRARAEKRKADLRNAVHRVIWCETEGEQADYLCALLEERMETWSRSPAFGLDDLDDNVYAACESLGLPIGSGNDWRNLPDPAWTDDPQAQGQPAPQPDPQSSG